MFRRRRPHIPEFGYDVFRLHSLMINTDVTEYNIVSDTKMPLLRWFPVISKIKTGDNITTGHYMNYKTFSNLEFRSLLKKSFHTIHNHLRDTSGEEIPFVTVGVTRFVFMFKKASNKHL